ncbi:hypothetical protein [Streptomyces sp. NPDC051993]|uniref:hypothetical protein n=1 Tax=Streptomyces sp. NPDC051993 TaxID=3155286 RepID=UPI003438784F
MTSPTTPFPPGLPHPATAEHENATVALAPGPAMRRKDDAEGVLSALPFTDLAEEEASTPPGPRVIACLTIRTPYRKTPSATSTCACGRDLNARGLADVLDLIAGHDYHRSVCLRRAPQDERQAA